MIYLIKIIVIITLVLAFLFLLVQMSPYILGLLVLIGIWKFYENRHDPRFPWNRRNL